MLALSLSAGHDPGLYRVEVIRKLISDGSRQRNASIATLARRPFSATEIGIRGTCMARRSIRPRRQREDPPLLLYFAVMHPRLLVMRLWSVTYPHQSVPDDFRDIHCYARILQSAHGARCHLLGRACDFALTSSRPQVLPYQVHCAPPEGEPLADCFLFLVGWFLLTADHTLAWNKQISLAALCSLRHAL